MSEDFTVKIWDANNYSLIKSCSSHTDRVWSIDIKSDDSIFLTGGSGKNMKIWDMNNDYSLK